MAAKTLTPDELHQRLFVTPPEAAAILLWDVRTVRRLIHDGTIPATKADQQYRIPAAWVRERAALNGQPGQLEALADRVSELEAAWSRLREALGGAA
jgi:excisionase family DNA binding protein